MLLQFLDLEMSATSKIYLPDHHHRIGSRIYSNLGFQPEIADGSGEKTDSRTKSTLYDVEIHPGLSYAGIHLNR